MLEHNSAGFIFFLACLSVTYVWMTGMVQRATAHDAAPGAKQKLFTSLITLPALGVAVSLSYPNYEVGLAGAGLLLGFVMTLNSVTHGLATLTTEPFAIGALSLVARRSGLSGDMSHNVQGVLARFGYYVTPDHLGYLTCGILAGIIAGIVPRFIMKHRAIQKAKMPVLNGHQRHLKKKKELKEKAILNSYSRKARRRGALVERMRALKGEP